MFKPNFKISNKTIRSLLNIEQLKSEVEKLPIRASLLKSLRETALLNSTHYSTQIEGNLLTLPEVAKVKAGDILISVDNKLLIDSSSMLETVAALQPGKSVPLKLLRNQREIVAQVKIGRRPKPKVK